MRLIKISCLVLGWVLGLVGVLGAQLFKPASASASLMFTAEELCQGACQAKEDAPRPGMLHCDGIIQGNNIGQVWLNGRCYTQEETDFCHESKQSIIIHQITPEAVDLSWFYKGKEHRITLKPNQSYNARLQKVVE
jgi:hypothetical protein